MKKVVGDFIEIYDLNVNNNIARSKNLESEFQISKVVRKLGIIKKRHL